MDTAQQTPAKVVMQYVPEANVPASERKGSVPPHIRAIAERQAAFKAKSEGREAEAAVVAAKEDVPVRGQASAAAIAEVDAILSAQAEPAAVAPTTAEPTAAPAAANTPAADDGLRAELAAMREQMANVDKYVQERLAAEKELATRAAAERAAAEQAALELTEEEEKLWATDKGVIAKIAGKAAREANAALQSRLDAAEAELQALKQNGQVTALQNQRSAEQEFADKVMNAVPELRQHLVNGQWSDAYKQAILRPVADDVDVTFFDKLKAANARSDLDAASRIIRNALGIKAKPSAAQSVAAVPGTAPAAVAAVASPNGAATITRQQFETIRAEYFKGAIPKEKWAAFDALYRKQQLSPQFINQGR